MFKKIASIVLVAAMLGMGACWWPPPYGGGGGEWHSGHDHWHGR